MRKELSYFREWSQHSHNPTEDFSCLLGSPLPSHPPFLLLGKPVVLFIDLRDNSKELHNFIYLSKQCDGVHTLFSEAQILQLGCLVCIGVNFIKEKKHRNSLITTRPIHLKPTNSERAQRDGIYIFFWDTAICFPFCKDCPYSSALFPLLPDYDRKPAHRTRVQLLCFIGCRK